MSVIFLTQSVELDGSNISLITLKCVKYVTAFCESYVLCLMIAIFFCNRSVTQTELLLLLLLLLQSLLSLLLLHVLIEHVIKCSIASGPLQKVDQKYLENFDIWYWRTMEKITWPGR